MIYSNFEFVALFAATFAAFLLARGRAARRAVLVVSSLLFYAWTGWFDTLIFLSVVAASWSAVALARRYPARRGLCLGSGIAVMAAHLFFWKYAAWAAAQVQLVFPGFLGGRVFRLPLPTGISFFTLQGIAYLVDYSNDDAKYMKFPTYLLFKSFFAQLVAGPIVRARQLLPQLETLEGPRPEDVSAGLALFTLGLMKKIVFADGIAAFADPVFAAPGRYGRGALIQALLGYAVQIWADFSGYTDMGRGAARMLGIRLPENFLSPYFSRTPSEFWRRWHITLSEWLRDYVYTPLALALGRRGLSPALWGGLITMAICGIWHGAGWHYLFYGLYLGLLLALEQALGFKIPEGGSALRQAAYAAVTFGLVLIAFLIFRTPDFPALFAYLGGIALGGGTQAAPAGGALVGAGVVFCAALHVALYYDFKTERWIAADWLRARVPALQEHALGAGAGALSGAALAALFVGAVFLRQRTAAAFIYFQF